MQARGVLISTMTADCCMADLALRTGRKEVIKRGVSSLSWPISEAHVSPQQHAK